MDRIPTGQARKHGCGEQLGHGGRAGLGALVTGLGELITQAFGEAPDTWATEMEAPDTRPAEWEMDPSTPAHSDSRAADAVGTTAAFSITTNRQLTYHLFEIAKPLIFYYFE
jgi:hypothetical protein